MSTVLEDLFSRVFVGGFFLVYIIAGVLMIQWALRTTWRRRRRSAKSTKPAKPSPSLDAPDNLAASPDLAGPPERAGARPISPRHPKGVNFFSARPSASSPPRD